MMLVRTWRRCAIAVLLVAAWGAPAAQESAMQVYERGKAALAAGDYRTAAEAFERAASMNPDSSSVFLNLGRALAGLQDHEGALRAYHRSLDVNPDNAAAHNNIANVYYREGRYDEAVVHYRRALELKPDYLLASFHLGWILRQRNEADAAEQAFRRCLELNASSAEELQTQEEARFYLGALRFRARDYEAAASYMQQVLARRPEHLEAHYYLGQSYLRLGRTEEARRLLEIHRELVESRRSDEPVASGGLR